MTTVKIIIVTKPKRSLGTGTNSLRRTRKFGLYSWNVRTLYQTGALKKLTDEIERVEFKHKIDVLTLQEIRWTRTGILGKSKHVMLYSGHQKKHEFGVGFLVNNRVKPTIISFEPVSHRICVLRIAGGFFNYTLINVYGPTKDSDEEERRTFMRYSIKFMRNTQDMM
jgi:exonuclease III